MRIFKLVAICAGTIGAAFWLIGCTAGPPQEGGKGLQSQLVEADVAALQSMMEQGEATSEAIVRAYIARIEKLDGDLAAVIEVNPDALAQARQRDEERRQGEVKGPLHGIPVLLKDNIESRDPMPTTAGSLALADNRTGRDAGLTERLRQAGAVILGKANLSEWANFRSERSSSGWSGVGGQTRNPYDPTRSPCGSSSGSAVAVAANLTALAVGTETDGSVVCPSTVNGIVGIKPTVGLVSRRGIVPISHSQDTAGPMGRSVADAVVLLEAMMGPDDADPATKVAAEAVGWDLRSHLRADGLRGKRIGVLRSATGYHDRVDELFDRAVAEMAEAGVEIVDGLEFDPPPSFEKDSYDVLLYEFKHDLDAYLAGLPDPALSSLDVERLIAFNRDHAAEEMPYFGQEIFEKAQAKGPLSEAAYVRALARIRRATREDGIDALVKGRDLDALIAPTGAPAWKIDLLDGDHFLGGLSSYPAIAGYPHLTVPMGAVQGMPVGLSIFGPALSEPGLIEIAYAYEQRTHHRRPPR